MSERTFLGAGMKFPPQIDPGTGRFAVSSKEQSVKPSNIQIPIMIREDYGQVQIWWDWRQPTHVLICIMI